MQTFFTGNSWQAPVPSAGATGQAPVRSAGPTPEEWTSPRRNRLRISQGKYSTPVRWVPPTGQAGQAGQALQRRTSRIYPPEINGIFGIIF